jgi:hypothetical protein
LEALYNLSPTARFFYLNTKNYWLYTEIVKFYLVVWQRKSFRIPGLGYRLANQGIVVQFPTGERDFSLLQKIYTSYEGSFPAYEVASA